MRSVVGFRNEESSQVNSLAPCTPKELATLTRPSMFAWLQYYTRMERTCEPIVMEIPFQRKERVQNALQSMIHFEGMNPEKNTVRSSIQSHKSQILKIKT